MKARIVLKMEVPEKFRAKLGILMEQFKEDLETSLCAAYQLPPEKVFVSEILQLNEKEKKEKGEEK